MIHHTPTSFMKRNILISARSLNGAVGDQNLCLMQFNVRSVRKKVDEMAYFLTQL